MPKNTRFVIVLCCLMPALFTACKKETAQKTTCASTIHGFTAPDSSAFTSYTYTCSHGIINPSTSGITTSGTFSGRTFFTQRAAYNATDNSYYVFGASGTMPSITTFLHKIDAGGSTSTYSLPDTATYSGLTYNATNHKLYCIRSGKLAELTLSGSTFSTTVVATPVHAPYYGYSLCASTTVNRTTGDLYLTTRDASGYYVEKYTPGGSTTTVVASGPTGVMPASELRYNLNDNKLYALRMNADTSTWDFIKIDPTSGSITSVAHLGTIINVDMYSGTLDECSNRYVLATKVNHLVAGIPTWTPILFQLNMSGTIVQHDTVASLYQGLDVQY